jgi:hypothetical protein
MPAAMLYIRKQFLVMYCRIHMDGDAQLDSLLAQHPAARAAYNRRIEELRFVRTCLLLMEQYLMHNATCSRSVFDTRYTPPSE